MIEWYWYVLPPHRREGTPLSVWATSADRWSEAFDALVLLHGLVEDIDGGGIRCEPFVMPDESIRVIARNGGRIVAVSRVLIPDSSNALSRGIVTCE